MMRFILAGMATVVAANAALADPPKVSCIDAKQSHVARPLNSHEIFVQNSIGTPKPPVRLTTSCHHLQSAIGFGLNSEFTCIAKGDTVIATLMGERQTCIVTAIVPYAPQDGDLPEKK